MAHLTKLPQMRPRSPDEPGRSDTPLELLFDLVFAVAVSSAASGLHAVLVAGAITGAVIGYLMAFFAIWWAWMNFTWFASAYDTDDWLYRITTIVQMGGALVLAAGIPGILSTGERDVGLTILGYVVMRLAMIAQWLRAAHGHPEGRRASLRYAVGIAMAQVYWVAAYLGSDTFTLWMFLIGMAAELAVPVWAESRLNTAWNPGHITDRYADFTIIVLGESILASTHGIIEAFGKSSHERELILLAATALVIVAGLWWIYFALPQHHLLHRLRTALGWGYTHMLIFACVAAVSTALQLIVDADSGALDWPLPAARLTLAIPLAIYVFLVWLIIARPQGSLVINVALPVAAAVLIPLALVPHGVQLFALVIAAAAALLTVSANRQSNSGTRHSTSRA